MAQAQGRMARSHLPQQWGSLEDERIEWLVELNLYISGYIYIYIYHTLHVLVRLLSRLSCLTTETTTNPDVSQVGQRRPLCRKHWPLARPTWDSGAKRLRDVDNKQWKHAGFASFRKRIFLLETTIFRGYVSFREGIFLDSERVF